MEVNIDNPLGTDAATTVAAAADAFAEMMDPKEDTPQVSEAQETESIEVDEVEVDEPEAQAEDEDTESDEDDNQDDVEDEPLYRVKINGEEAEVPLSEALKGYQRQQDYTRKTEELAKLRREEDARIAAETEATRAERLQYQQVLAQLSQQLNQPDEAVDWDYLRQTDPIEYAAKYAEHQQKRERQQMVAQEQQRLAQIQQQEQQVTFQRHMAVERERLISAIPEWSDNEVAKREKREVMEFARSIGFTEQELQQTYDHRAVLTLRDAMKYRQLKARKLEVKPVQTTKVVKPGSANSVKPKSKFKQAQQRLAKTGRVDDAAAAFESLLFGE